MVASVVITFAGALPSHMKAAQASGTPCEKPDWTCISENTVPVPRPQAGQILVAMKGSSVNPVNVDFVEPICKSIGACTKGTIGNDGSGVVVEVNACEGFKVGDEVWMLGGQYAEYAVVPCAAAGLKPNALSFVDAGTIPVVGMTSLQCLRAAGMPLTNMTVAVTSGQGGTGFMGVQLAKALGASRVITAATGDGIELMKKLGAEIVIDYHKQDLFDALEDDSVDVVYDNFGLKGTADKAMHAIRSGGVLMILMGGNGGQPSSSPKEGVRQVPNCRTKDMGTEDLDTLAKLFDAGKLQPHTMSPTYDLAEVPQAFTRLLSHGVLGKIAIVPTTTNVVSV
jgi:NADPH:quinone reductase-like Zn-dependent oxidoreductase